jgi:hypothetical protein
MNINKEEILNIPEMNDVAIVGGSKFKGYSWIEFYLPIFRLFGGR